LLAHSEHLTDGAVQVVLHDGAVGQVAFSLGTLFGENVAVISVMSLDFAGAGQSESLLGGGLGFDFWHFFEF
jgi:hypothetical protein